MGERWKPCSLRLGMPSLPAAGLFCDRQPAGGWVDCCGSCGCCGRWAGITAGDTSMRCMGDNAYGKIGNGGSSYPERVTEP